jgi:hypothetical protein
LSSARSKIDRAPEKYGHVKRETGPVQGKGRGGPDFLSSVIPASPCSPDEQSDIRERSRGFDAAPGFRFAHPGYEEENEGSGTPANAG